MINKIIYDKKRHSFRGAVFLFYNYGKKFDVGNTKRRENPLFLRHEKRMPTWVFYLMIACLGRGRLFAGKKCCVEPYASKLTTAFDLHPNPIRVAHNTKRRENPLFLRHEKRTPDGVPSWRRKRDSNPRGFWPNGFQDRLVVTASIFLHI